MPDQVLGVYFRHLANYIRTYGTLAGVIAFLTWLYWDAFAVLLGAELNVKLAKESAQGTILLHLSPAGAVPHASTKTQRTISIIWVARSLIS